MMRRLGLSVLVVALVSGGTAWTPLVTGAQAETTGVDLEPVHVGVFPGDPAEDDEIRLSANITNSGNASAGSFQLALELHDPNSSAFERIENVTVASLEPGEHATVVHEGLTLPDGHYELRAIADVTDEINETDETNNEASKLFTVDPAEGTPNLVAQLQLHSRHVSVDEPLRATYGVSNVGGGAAGSFVVEAHLDGEVVERTRLGGLDAHMGVGWIDQIGPIEDPGTHELVLVLDAEDEVDESTERDNRDGESFEVILPPDPAVTAIDVTKERLRTDATTGPANPVAGQDVEVTVENVGEGDIDHHFAHLTVEACPEDAAVFSPIATPSCERIAQTLLEPDEIERGTTVEAHWDTFGKAGDWTVCAQLEIHGVQTDPANDERCQETFVLAGGTGLGGIDAT